MGVGDSEAVLGYGEYDVCSLLTTEVILYRTNRPWGLRWRGWLKQQDFWRSSGSTGPYSRHSLAHTCPVGPTSKEKEAKTNVVQAVGTNGYESGSGSESSTLQTLNNFSLYFLTSLISLHPVLVMSISSYCNCPQILPVHEYTGKNV